MSKNDPQAQHEARIDALIKELAGRGAESDWALARALVHRAVHLIADRRAAEFCRVAVLFAEMVTHAHELMHSKDEGQSHQDVVH